MSRLRTLAITRRILAQLRHDRRTLALTFVLPLVVLGLFYALLRGGGERPEMGLVDQGGGALGAAIAQQLHASDRVRVADLDLQTARARLEDRSLAGYALVPPGLSAQLHPGGTVAVTLWLEGTDPGPSATVTAALQQAVAGAVQETVPVRPPRLEPQVRWLHGGPGLDTFDYFSGAFVGVAIFFLVFVITIVSFLRERGQGTLERLMATPLRRREIVAGYVLGFGALALAQAVEVLVFAVYVLRMHNEGNVGVIFVMEMLLALAAVNLGIFLSMFARTEFQAVQFIPLVIVPQILLSGVVVPVSSEPTWMQWLSHALPLTYAVDGLRQVMLRGAGPGTSGVVIDGAVVLAFGLAALAGATLSLRRQVA